MNDNLSLAELQEKIKEGCNSDCPRGYTEKLYDVDDGYEHIKVTFRCVYCFQTLGTIVYVPERT
jgi:hypothetical protein